jgi:hypothetical protein
MITAETSLKVFLRIAGAICLVAILPFFMPRTWIVACHEWLGLGAFPQAPIAEYLARATSGLCAFYGGLLWVLSADVRRYAPVITYQAVAIIFLALVGTVLSIRCGMPMHWAVSDAAGASTIGVLSLLLQWRIRAADHKAVNGQ